MGIIIYTHLTEKDLSLGLFQGTDAWASQQFPGYTLVLFQTAVVFLMSPNPWVMGERQLIFSQFWITTLSDVINSPLENSWFLFHKNAQFLIKSPSPLLFSLSRWEGAIAVTSWPWGDNGTEI